MPLRPWRAAAAALLPFALHGLAREVDAAVGVLLHTTLDLPGFVPTALGLLDAGAVARAVALWTLIGAAAWTLLAGIRGGPGGAGFRAALAEEPAGFAPLYLRPALTVLALAALAVQPTYPYGFTLPVALTQDWGVAQDVAAAAALLAGRLQRQGLAPRWRLPPPGPVSVWFLAFLAYALIAPEGARRWENHPGNEPKTLRMAVAAGHWLSLDTEPVSAGMEDLPVSPLPGAVARAGRGAARETWRLFSALVPGGPGVGAEAIRATRITRQVVRGKEGGVYTVLAPGPSLLLAGPLRLDRAWNRRHGTPGRLGFTLLFWNALAAALVAALFMLLREATGRPGLAAAVAILLAFLPPFLLYSFQFYPEMVGALALAALARLLLFVPRWSMRACVGMGLLLASLPWMHQKFLPVWLVLSAVALGMAVHRLLRLPAVLALAVPQVLSGFLTALYNFAVTGSARPDALYLAWGPKGVTSARVGQGLLGLMLDARYGLLPYVPILMLGVAGLALPGPAARKLRLALPAALVYYLTVASADNWSGAVCNLGRYAMPVVPLLAAAVALALTLMGGRRGALALALMLAGWSVLIARLLWLDPHAANDCALLLARGTFADGNAYVPNLFIRMWQEAAPGLWARIAVWAGLLAALAAWMRRAAGGRGGGSPLRVLGGVAAVALACAFALERWPAGRTAPRFGDAVELPAGATAFVSGAVEVEQGVIRARGGALDLLVRSREPRASLRLLAEGEGVLRVPGLPPLALRGREVEVEVPLEPLRRLTGRRGVEESLARQALGVESAAGVVLRPAP
jgi:hypothetical protein